VAAEASPAAISSQSAAVAGPHQHRLQDTFEFDSSEIGSFSYLGNFEEYTGPCLVDYDNFESTENAKE